MKLRLILLLTVLFQPIAFSQNNWAKITYPVYGSVMQGTTQNLNQIDVCFQVLNQSSIDWRISLFTYEYSTSNPTTKHINTVPAYFNKSLNDPSLGFTISYVPGNSSYSYISGKLNNLPKKQYVIQLHRGEFFDSFFESSVIADLSVFGVGDVYFIAGQSNAAGYNVFSKSTWLNLTNIENRRGLHDGTNTVDLTIPFKLNHQNIGNELTRSLNFNGRFDYFASVDIISEPELLELGITEDERALIETKSRKYNELSPNKGNWFGLPYGHKYERLRNGTDKLNDPVHIFPNGQASWYWAILGQKIGIEKNVPTLFFNVASPGTSLIRDWTKDDYATGGYPDLQEKFLKTLALYGSAHGVKAVLWHQGEEDAERASTVYSGIENVTLSSYTSRLNGLINNSRNYMGDVSKNIAWYISKVSLFTNTNNGLTNSSGNSGISTATSLGGGRYQYTNSTLTNQQSTSVLSSSNKVYAGFTNSDVIGGNIRDNKFKIHFTGEKDFSSSLNLFDKIANDWNSAIYLKYNDYNGIAPSDLFKIESISQSGNSVTITYQSGGSEYYFTRGQNGVFEGSISGLTGNYKSFSNQVSNNTSRTYTFNNIDLNEGEFLTCYVKVGNKLVPGQPYFATPLNQTPSSKVLEVSNPLMNVSSVQQNITNNVHFKNVTWGVVSKPNWVSNISTVSSFAEGNLDITFDQNVGTSRTGQILIQEVGGGLSKTITINQSGTAALTTSLTSLTPTSTSGGYQINKSVDQNTMQIAGVQYTQGIGVHANNSMVYNLAGQYSTFYGKIGQDDESNCGDGIQFSIKADGVTIYGPVSKTYGQAATNFSISVSGKNTLELVTDIIGNNYCDHADWADVYLQSGSGGCGTPPIAPVNVLASPSTISAGGSATLSASCGIGTVTWSTGATGASISVSPTVTTNYTVKCVSVACPDSPLVGVTVNVPSGGGGSCSAVTDNLTMGTWTVTNHPLVARYFNNQYWLTQRLGTNPEKFLVRGSEMLTRGDVNLANGSYSSLTSCFGWQYSNYGGLEVPNSTQFPTPNGFTLGYEPSGTPFYTATGGCSNPPTTATNVTASPANINSGQSSTLSANCAIGTRLWSTGATTATIVVNPTSTTTYTVKCVASGCNDSPTASVTVQVGPCASLSHNLVLGTWNVTGHQLVAKYYHNKWWLVQRIATNPEKLLVRGSEMLTRGDVSLNNGTYSSLVGCFEWAYSGWGGLGVPNSSQFPTPSGWQYGTEPDGTPFYTSTGGARIAAETAIELEEKPSFVSIYPNPNKGVFSIKVYLESVSSLEIDLINSSGKIYQSQKAKGKVGQNEIPFSALNISGGNYLIRVRTKDKVETKVVVIIQ